MVAVAAAATAPTVTARATVPSTSCVTGASRPKVASLTPQLKVTVADADSASVTAQFEWWTVAGEARMGGANVSVAAGATAAATVPAGAFVSGGRYKWRARAFDGALYSAWTTFCEQQVYTGTAPSADCAAGIDHDYNGDGYRDVAAGDPDYNNRSGRVTVTYGNNALTGTKSFTQGSTEVPHSGVEAGEQFGFALATYDANRDGCSDLVVSTPFEGLGDQDEAGVIGIVYGSPKGLGLGTTTTLWYTSNGFATDPWEAGDWFGYSLAATNLPNGEPVLIVGTPGEDIDGVSDAGIVHYWRGTTVTPFYEGLGVAGSPEANDRVGFSLSISPNHFAIGVPGEAVGSGVFAGIMGVYSHEQVSGRPKYMGSGTEFLTDPLEQGDEFGKSMSMVAYQSAANAGESLLVVGEPGEDVNAIRDSGMLHRFKLTAAGIEYLGAVTQFTPGIGGGAEDGDHFGEHVLAVNTAPESPPTAKTVIIAVSAPGEDLGTVPDAGGVAVFAGLESTIPASSGAGRGGGGLPGVNTPGELVGNVLGGNPEFLYVGSLAGDGTLYRFPWAQMIVADRTGRVDLPAPAGEVAYGAAIG
ncbi:hypothetical protein ACTI_46920 [Actinoplanes sp. OR16]|nr:hypothetical protein ACTI_46920 [Actinoplanes sp. OR16]